MNREIKFRVWDNVDYLSAPFTLQDLHNKIIQFTSDCVVVQYTGLKDKAGKEIFEGDIVQDIVMGSICQIVFTDYANFGLSPLNFKMDDLKYEVIDPAYSETTLEVIGNIYENPDLLKKEEVQP